MDDTTFEAKWDEVTTSMERIGLYAAGHQWLVPGDHSHDDDPDYVEPDAKHAVLMARFNLGDLAFSKRVMEPESVEWDKEFGLMVASDTIATTKETIEGLHEKMKRGENPFAPE
jgi:hypothetical protein